MICYICAWGLRPTHVCSWLVAQSLSRTHFFGRGQFCCVSALFHSPSLLLSRDFLALHFQGQHSSCVSHSPLRAPLVSQLFSKNQAKLLEGSIMSHSMSRPVFALAQEYHCGGIFAPLESLSVVRTDKETGGVRARGENEFFSRGCTILGEMTNSHEISPRLVT